MPVYNGDFRGDDEPALWGLPAWPLCSEASASPELPFILLLWVPRSSGYPSSVFPDATDPLHSMKLRNARDEQVTATTGRATHKAIAVSDSPSCLPAARNAFVIGSSWVTAPTCGVLALVSELGQWTGLQIWNSSRRPPKILNRLQDEYVREIESSGIHASLIAWPTLFIRATTPCRKATKNVFSPPWIAWICAALTSRSHPRWTVLGSVPGVAEIADILNAGTETGTPPTETGSGWMLCPMSAENFSVQ